MFLILALTKFNFRQAKITIIFSLRQIIRAIPHEAVVSSVISLFDCHFGNLSDDLIKDVTSTTIAVSTKKIVTFNPMNYLAHAHLSFQNESILVGNMIGDTIKKKEYEVLPDEIKIGVNLHRAIDEYTDRNRIVLNTRSYFSPTIKHYAMVISDVIYDHYLAANWNKYEKSTLNIFAQKTYQILEKNESFFPERFSQLYPYMKTGNWLELYGTIDGIENTIRKLGKRSESFIWADETIDIFKSKYQLIGADFEEFYKELIVFCKTYVKQFGYEVD